MVSGPTSRTYRGTLYNVGEYDDAAASGSRPALVTLRSPMCTRVYSSNVEVEDENIAEAQLTRRGGACSGLGGNGL